VAVRPPLTDPGDRAAFPELTGQQMARVRARANRRPITVGEVLYRAGDIDYGFFVIESGEVEVVRDATPDSPEQLIATITSDHFMGELNLLTGQVAYLSARVIAAGAVWTLDHDGFRLLMAEDPELSDVILQAFIARRLLLRDNEANRSVEVIGSSTSASALALRNWASRLGVPHHWFDAETEEGARLLDLLERSGPDLPVVRTPTGAVLSRATPGELAEHLGLTYRVAPGRVFDLVVAGGGPAGMAAAMYGASEGLDTMLVESVAVGGQAGASSRIENYLGFPSGLAGQDLMARALVQAQKFGAGVSSPCEAMSLRVGQGPLVITLVDGTDVAAHAVIVATGAAYRRLDLERWSDFEGAGIYYAATKLEADNCGGAHAPVTVVGGANSAGQAALFLCGRGARVRIVVRRHLADAMSRYLVERIEAEPSIEVHEGTEVVAVRGGATLESITLRRGDADEHLDVPCTGLFCFIGAVPATGWLEGVALDEDGFVLTGADLGDPALRDRFELLGRDPLPFETSVPGVFAAGDVRRGSMKRVAAAVGEGASAVRSVHQATGN
jgi:thioredoxin reductase (NADPH)